MYKHPTLYETVPEMKNTMIYKDGKVKPDEGFYNFLTDTIHIGSLKREVIAHETQHAINQKIDAAFKGTNIIDLRGNVRITNETGQIMETEQLYFDQKNEWFFTEEAFTFKDADGSYLQGIGIDFSKDFKVINSQKLSGEMETNK